MNILLIIFTLAVLGVAVWYDITQFRIPNWLTLGATGVALLISFFMSGPHLLFNHLLGALVLGGVWLVFWRVGIMGGGDQKLMLFVGAALGLLAAPTAFLLVAFAGGLQAFGTIIYRKFFFSATLPEKFWKKIPLPYSAAIALGAAVTMLLAARHQLPLVF